MPLNQTLLCVYFNNITFVKDEIIARIRTVMAHYELTVSAFADAIGVQRSSVSHLLSGRNKPSLDFVMKLIQAYPKVTFHWLLYGEGSFPDMENFPSPTPNASYKKEAEIVHLRKKQSFIPSFKSGEKQPAQVVLLYADGSFETFSEKRD